MFVLVVACTQPRVEYDAGIWSFVKLWFSIGMGCWIEKLDAEPINYKILYVFLGTTLIPMLIIEFLINCVCELGIVI